MPSGISNISGVGLPGDYQGTAAQIGTQPANVQVRPYVRVEILSTWLPDSSTPSGIAKGDENRWYRFAIGLDLDSLAGQGSDTSGLIQFKDDSDKSGVKTLTGNAGLSRISVKDSLTGQSASCSLQVTDFIKKLLPNIRQQDRMRIILVHPWATTPRHQFLLFDGLLRSCQTSFRGGNGFGYTLELSGAGLPSLLSGATFNWQAFIHPDSDLLNGSKEGATLFQKMTQAALPCQDVARIFIESCLFSAMGVRFGDWNDIEGLTIDEYVQFSEFDWRSVENTKLAMPWENLVQQGRRSFWQIVQSVTEPFLHEVFTRYELIEGDDLESPVLVHRPIPFPGLEKYDEEWKSLSHYALRNDAPYPMGVEEEINTNAPNCIHWEGLGNGDYSNQTFLSKLLFGFMTSESLINRFGFHSIGAPSKAGPLTAGAKAEDVFAWTKDRLNHYGLQFIPTALTRNRQISIPFLPVRPGMAFEDFTLGATWEKCVTGYINATSFDISSSRDGFNMRMEISLERCIYGTDFDHYPEAHRALIDDIKFQQYAGIVGGPPAMFPNKNREKPPQTPITYGTVKSIDPVYPYQDAIAGAGKKYNIPPWVIAQILQNETSMGTNYGVYTRDRSYMGIAQIQNTTAADLVSLNVKNPDGSYFQASDRGDTTNCIYACAAYLDLRCKPVLGPVEGDPDYYAWMLRCYRWGPGGTSNYGADNDWTFPGTDATHGAHLNGSPSAPLVTDDQQGDYKRYWSPGAAAGGQARFGGIGNAVAGKSN